MAKLVTLEVINGGPEPVNAVDGGYYNGEREHLEYTWRREIADRVLGLAS